MGGRTISGETITEVERLLALGGMSDKKISEEVEISRSSVKLIRRGEFRPGAKLGAARKGPIQFEPCDQKECPGCKQTIIVKPCVICAARERRGKS